MVSTLAQTGPELIELFDNFAFDEVVNSDDLDDRTRMLAILATLLSCQGVEEFEKILPAALNLGVTPIVAKEVSIKPLPILVSGGCTRSRLSPMQCYRSGGFPSL